MARARQNTGRQHPEGNQLVRARTVSDSTARGSTARGSTAGDNAVSDSTARGSVMGACNLIPLPLERAVNETRGELTTKELAWSTVSSRANRSDAIANTSLARHRRPEAADETMRTERFHSVELVAPGRWTSTLHSDCTIIMSRDEGVAEHSPGDTRRRATASTVRDHRWMTVQERRESSRSVGGVNFAEHWNLPRGDRSMGQRGEPAGWRGEMHALG